MADAATAARAELARRELARRGVQVTSPAEAPAAPAESGAPNSLFDGSGFRRLYETGRDVVQAGAKGVTGIAGGLGGQLAGLGALVADAAYPGDPGALFDPSEVQARVANALTYQPTNPQSVPSKVVDFPGKVFDAASNFLTEQADKTGLPYVGSIAGALPDIGANVLGVKAATMLPRGAPGAAPARPGAIPREVPATGAGFGPDSAGAAAAAIDVAAVPAELRPALVKAAQRGDREVATRVIEAETLPVPIRLTEGQARQDPILISDEMNMRGTNPDIAARLKEQNQALIDNLDEVRREVAPNVVANDHIQNGQALIDAYKSYDEPVRAEISAAYQALEAANGGQLPINAKAFVDAADAALAKKLKARYLPKEVRGDLDQIRESGGMLTFEQLENLRTNLATAARDADRGTLGGGGNAAAAIRLVRDALEEFPMEGAGAELKALADRARALSRERFERIRKDPAYEAAVDDPTPPGELSPFADDFVKKYVVNGKSANIKRMQETLAGDPIVGETVAAAALNYVKSKSGVNLYTNEGNFSQAGYNRALGEITPRLEVLVPPEAGELLQRLGNVARNVMVQPRGSLVNNSNTFTAAARDAAKSYAEGTLNTVVPGAQVGTFIRQRRAASREKNRATRALDPARYLGGPED